MSQIIAYIITGIILQAATKDKIHVRVPSLNRTFLTTAGQQQMSLIYFFHTKTKYQTHHLNENISEAFSNVSWACNRSVAS